MEVNNVDIKTKARTVSQQTLKDAGLDIATVQAAGFMINARRKDVTIGHISIYEIDKLISNRQEPPPDDPKVELRQLIKQKLLLLGYAGATLAHFFKKDLDILPPYRDSVNYNIKLIVPNTLTSSPLYSILLKQLQLVYNYLNNYLQRGFITYSNASYASPILFAKKPRGGQYFYINYRKLNVIIKKDTYLILLIQETLT